MGRKVMICAGEASGDIYGALLVGALKEADPELEFFGLGGDGMAGEGVELTAHIRDLSVMGIWEVIRDLGRVRALLARSRRELVSRRPDILIVIDFYRFNIVLARTARSLGIPVVYYVAPKLWAWGEHRIRALKRNVDLVLAVFPFEEQFYRERDVPVKYVGNPLTSLLNDEDIEPFRSGLGLDPEDRVIGLLPGSRPAEVRQLLWPFVAAAELASREMDQKVRFLLPLAHTVPRALVDGILSRFGVVVTVVEGQSRKVLRASDVCLVASGTATLEAFLLGTPQVVAYRTSWLTSFLGSRVLRIPRVSLPNILTGEDVVDELLQEDVMPERLARALLELMNDEQRRTAYARASQQAGEMLSGWEAPGLAASAVLQVLSGGKGGSAG